MAPAGTVAFLRMRILGPQVATAQFSEPSGSVPTLAPASTTVFSPTMAYFTTAPFSTTAPGISTLKATSAPSATTTLGDRTELST